MYAQIFLGLFWLFAALTDWMQKPILLSKALRHRASRHYKRFLALPHGLMGLIFMAMGMLERRSLLPTRWFILLYIGLACIPMALLLFNIKKHFGKMMIRSWNL